MRPINVATSEPGEATRQSEQSNRSMRFGPAAYKSGTTRIAGCST